MKKNAWPNPMWIWAAHGLREHPAQAIVLFCVLSSLTALFGLWMLLSQTLATASARMIEQGPAVVVRRVSAGGWLPMPVQEALVCVQSIAGVLTPRPRLWGVVGCAQRPVTVIGLIPEGPSPWLGDQPRPAVGQALIGAGVHTTDTTDLLTLVAARTMRFEVIGRLPRASAMATHDLVLLNDHDARALLGVAAGQASDLVFDLFHEEETLAVCADLAEAFPWPVQIVTRRQTLERSLTDIARRTGLGLLVAVPALLALVLMAMAVGMGSHRRRWQAGLFKAMGWTGGDLLRLQGYQALLVAGPGLAVGAAAAYSALYWPGMTWVAKTLFDWSGPAPALYLTVQGAAAGLVLAAAAVGLPFWVAAFWAAWCSVAADPGDLLEGGR